MESDVLDPIASFRDRDYCTAKGLFDHLVDDREHPYCTSTPALAPVLTLMTNSAKRNEHFSGTSARNTCFRAGLLGLANALICRFREIILREFALQTRL
jgi:hypothetical protein